MTAPEGPRRRGGATRARLLEAGLELFVTRGYHGTTTALLAARTRLAEGTIYRHFRNKEALYTAVARACWERGRAVLEEVPGGRMPTRQRLAHAAARLAEEAERRPLIVRFLLQPSERDRLDETAVLAEARFRETLVQLVAGGKQEGTIRAGSAELWAGVWFAIVGFVCGRIALREWSFEMPAVRHAVDAAWDAIQAGGAEGRGGAAPGAGSQ